MGLLVLLQVLVSLRVIITQTTTITTILQRIMIIMSIEDSIIIGIITIITGITISIMTKKLFGMLKVEGAKEQVE